MSDPDQAQSVLHRLLDRLRGSASTPSAPERRSTSDRRGGERRVIDEGPPDGVERRSGEERRSGSDRRVYNTK